MSSEKKRRILFSYLIRLLLPLMANEWFMAWKLARYKATRAGDDTAEFLRAFFERIPIFGYKSLLEAIVRCFGDEELRQLVERTEFGLLRALCYLRGMR